MPSQSSVSSGFVVGCQDTASLPKLNTSQTSQRLWILRPGGLDYLSRRSIFLKAFALALSAAVAAEVESRTTWKG